MICKRITIVARGNTEHELAAAFEEAFARIDIDCYIGGDSADDSGLYFKVEDDVPAADWPA